MIQSVLYHYAQHTLKCLSVPFFGAVTVRAPVSHRAKLQCLKLSKIIFKFRVTNIDNIIFQVSAVTNVLLKTEILRRHYVDHKETQRQRRVFSISHILGLCIRFKIFIKYFEWLLINRFPKLLHPLLRFANIASE